MKTSSRLVLLFLVFLISISILLVGFEESVAGEVPCVDGRNRINLEGIMCEDLKTTFFGVHEAFGLFFLLPTMAAGIYTVRGILE